MCMGHKLEEGRVRGKGNSSMGGSKCRWEGGEVQCPFFDTRGYFLRSKLVVPMQNTLESPSRDISGNQFLY